MQVVIDSAGLPVTLIEIADVRVVKIGDIDHARTVGKGEGYASVAEWRSGHERLWHSREYRDDLAFIVNDDTLTVARQFGVVADADDHQVFKGSQPKMCQMDWLGPLMLTHRGRFLTVDRGFGCGPRCGGDGSCWPC